MNSLSWLIYLASVCEGINHAIVVSLTISAIALAVFAFGNLIIVASGGPTIWSWDDKAEKLAAWRKTEDFFKAKWKLPAKVLVAALVINAFFPSQTTVYAIAASEMGEKALNTDTGSKAVQALNAWLDRQISGEDEAKAEQK